MGKKDLVVVANQAAGVASNAAFSLSSEDGWSTARLRAVQRLGDVYPTTGVLRDGKLYVIYSKLNELIQSSPEQRERLQVEGDDPADRERCAVAAARLAAGPGRRRACGARLAVASGLVFALALALAVVGVAEIGAFLCDEVTRRDGGLERARRGIAAERPDLLGVRQHARLVLGHRRGAACAVSAGGRQLAVAVSSARAGGCWPSARHLSLTTVQTCPTVDHRSPTNSQVSSLVSTRFGVSDWHVVSSSAVVRSLSCLLLSAAGSERPPHPCRPRGRATGRPRVLRVESVDSFVLSLVRAAGSGRGRARSNRRTRGRVVHDGAARVSVAARGATIEDQALTGLPGFLLRDRALWRDPIQSTPAACPSVCVCARSPARAGWVQGRSPCHGGGGLTGDGALVLG